MAFILSVVLAPVLILSIVQSALIFQREVFDERSEMTGAAERSAAAVGARIASADVLLRTLIPAATGPKCAERLIDIRNRIPGYVNFIRFAPDGAAECAADPAPEDDARAVRPWFRRLVDGKTVSVTNNPGPAYATEPVIVTSVRFDDAKGHMKGVLSGVITLASLRPERDGRTVPDGSEVALVDGAGRLLTSSRSDAFPESAVSRHLGARWGRATLWFGKDRLGHDRVFAAAPLADENIHVVLSAPNRNVVAWAGLNPLSAIGLPVLAFALALAGVWIVADRGVVRWIAYLQRIAAIYARGRYGVHPIRAAKAPPEIHDLAKSLDAMAGTIAARDRSLRESLVQKDRLLKEIHHRVKNNLQVISSLLNMQQRALTDPAARTAIMDTRQRIAALALIYRALYEGPDLRRIDLRDFLQELIGQLVINDGSARATIQTRLSIDPLSIDPDQLAPLALFAVEAITNAKKHGLPETGGVLEVAFRVTVDGAELVVSDPGRPDAGPATLGAGVGRTLMVAFARQLNGAVDFHPNPGGGLTARLTFALTTPSPQIGE